MKTNPSLKIFLTCVVISFLSFSLVFADSTDASTDAAATLNLRLKLLLNYVSWVWIWLSKIA